MIVFWSTSATMLLVALGALLPALLGRSQARVAPADEANLAVFRDRLAELEAERDAGVLSPAQFEQARYELDRDLLHDIPRARHVDVGAERRRRRGWTAGAVALGLPVLALTLYGLLGAPELITLAPPAQNAHSPHGDSPMHAIDEMVARLAARLQQQPNDGEGWAMLGRSYVTLNRASEAVVAFSKAHALIGDQPQLLADYAEALALANGEELAGKPAQLVARALELAPTNQKALWLAGVEAANRGARQEADEHWQRLLKQLPAASQEAETLRQQIAELEGTGVAAEAAAPNAVAPSAVAPALDVRVSLAPALADQVAPGDTLFVFARAARGPAMPLAMVRRQARELPLAVTLDDSLAMAPNMKLSNFTEVVVGARVSKSGNALPQSGDLQGLSAAIPVSASGALEVVINQVVP